MLDSTAPGEAGNQTVPSVYFSPNEHFQVIQETAIQGMLLTIASTEKSIIFCFEFHENPFIKYFNSTKNKFIPFLVINRSNIGSFKKNEEVKLKAVKAKRSYQIMSNIGSAPVGGLITGAIFTGAFNLASKLEGATFEKIGVRYTLGFQENNEEKSIDIICEKFYINDFDNFLNIHWTNSKPQIPKAIAKKDGCFIATACYGNYDHPNVITLRNFRDDVLTKSKSGRMFISFYYKYSPAIARQIEKSVVIKRIIRNVLIHPLVSLTTKSN
jgi:hypothetical protein